MTDSPLHQILNEIRSRYTGQKVSLLDLRKIEGMYNICSIINTRNHECSFIRITSFGVDGIMFEDIAFSYEKINVDYSNLHHFIFQISKVLYELAYGVELQDENKEYLVEIIKPSIKFETMHNEIISLQQQCKALENKIALLEKNAKQISIFDLDTN